VADVARRDDVKKLAKDALAKMGRIDILITMRG